MDIISHGRFSLTAKGNDSKLRLWVRHPSAVLSVAVGHRSLSCPKAECCWHDTDVLSRVGGVSVVYKCQFIVLPRLFIAPTVAVMRNLG